MLHFYKILKCLQEIGLWANGSFPRGINETTIELIPNWDNPSPMKDYRPIALCNVI